MAAVGAPDRVGVVAAVRLDVQGGAGQQVIDIDAAVGAEGVLLAHVLAAGIDDVASVRTPVQLLGAAERFGREFEQFLGAEDVRGVLRGDLAVAEGGHVGAGNVGHPVVPVAVHQVFGGVGLRLVQVLELVRRLLQGRILDAAHIQDLVLVRRELVVGNAVRNVTQLHLLAEFVPLEGGLPELPALQEEDALAVGGPAGGADALGEAGQLDLAAAVRIAEEQVAATLVVGYGGVGNAVQDPAPVGRELGVGQAAEREERLGRHHAVRDADVGRTDVSAVFFLCTTDGHGQTH